MSEMREESVNALRAAAVLNRLALDPEFAEQLQSAAERHDSNRASELLQPLGLRNLQVKTRLEDVPSGYSAIQINLRPSVRPRVHGEQAGVAGEQALAQRRPIIVIIIIDSVIIVANW